MYIFIFLFHTESTLNTLRQRLLHDISKLNRTIAFARQSEVSSSSAASSSSAVPASSHLTKLMTLENIQKQLAVCQSKG